MDWLLLGLACLGRPLKYAVVGRSKAEMSATGALDYA